MLPRIYSTGIVTASMLREDSLFLFQIQKNEVNDSNFARIDQLMGECKKAKRNARSKIGLAFAYDDDPRELYDIPEVCCYIDTLFAAHPHILYHLSPDVDAVRAFVLSIMRCSLPTDSGQSSVYEDFNTFKAIISKHVDAAISYASTINDIAGARGHLSCLDRFM